MSNVRSGGLTYQSFAFGAAARVLNAPSIPRRDTLGDFFLGSLPGYRDNI